MVARRRNSSWQRSRNASKTRARSTDPNVVKVVTDRGRRCDLFFALRRFPIDAGTVRRPRLTSSTSGCMFTGAISCWRIPRCRSARWSRPSGWNSCGRSRTGYQIRVVETEYESLGVDTPEDLERVSQLVRSINLTGSDAMAKYIFVTGGVVSSLGKGHRRGVHRLPAGKPRTESHAARSSIRT